MDKGSTRRKRGRCANEEQEFAQIQQPRLLNLPLPPLASLHPFQAPSLSLSKNEYTIKLCNNFVQREKKELNVNNLLMKSKGVTHL